LNGKPLNPEHSLPNPKPYALSPTLQVGTTGGGILGLGSGLTQIQTHAMVARHAVPVRSRV